MATTNMKRIVADGLANLLATNVPGLSGKVTAVAAGPETNMPCLAAKIIPGPFTFTYFNEDEVYYNATTDDGKVIFDVGSWTGQFTIELYTTSPAEREKYEQAIQDYFMSSDWCPGVVFVETPNLTVNGYVSLYNSEARVSINDEDWIEEMSFESKRYSFITVDVDYSALTTRDAATIQDLELWLETDVQI